MWRYLIILLCFISNTRTESMWRTVMTTQGPVRGCMESDGVYVFYNIPYARAPTGLNKFKGPLPPPYWTKPFVAIDKGVICPQAEYQSHTSSKNKIMLEDCLITNVYVPNTEKKNLSVVLFVHGGTLQVGFGEHPKAKKLMASKKIITVTFNYRLGVHGFLCLGTKDIPGNAGMKDIVAMLRWLKRNIASFGGNPDDITVSGYSSGATAVDLLILSKSANRLFNKVIIESGANTALFAVQLDPMDTAKSHAFMLNFTNAADVYALEYFYKTISLDILTSKIYSNKIESSFVFGPCVENGIEEEVFLTESPIKILKNGDYAKVPMLYGFTSMEGLTWASSFDRWKTAMMHRFSDFLPSDLIFNSEDQKINVAKHVKQFYFGEIPVGAGSVQSYINYITDVMFISPALRSVSLNVASGNNQIYLYYYSFMDISDPFVGRTSIRGARHCAQSLAILDDFRPRNTSLEFIQLRKTMRQMWHNFITTGKPIPEGSTLNLKWPPTTVDRSPYMSLGQEVKLDDKILENRASFWDNLYKNSYREPVPPPIPTSSRKILINPYHPRRQ